MPSLTARSLLFATAYFAFTAQALPKPASYSVVDVDGGKPTTPLPTTIYHTQSAVAESEKTVSVTVVEAHTPAPAPPQEPVTVTEQGPVVIASPPVAASTTTSSTSSSSTSSSTSTLTSTPAPSFATSFAPEETTLTVTTTAANPSTTSYYDNGMWHTSYAIRPENHPDLATAVAGSSISNSPSSVLQSGVVERAAPTAAYKVVSWNQLADY